MLKSAQNGDDDGRKSRVTAKLIASFKALISDGVLAPGTKLPPERELAKRFGVNRASLRQVLKVLEIMGVLSQRVGDGTYVNSSAAAILDEPLDFLFLLDDISQHELFETRLIVEPELAARAAERATVEDLAAIEKAIDDMEKSRTIRARLDADLAFHEAIFRAAGNRVCTLVFTVIHRNILNSMAQLSGRVALQRPLSYHKTIYDAIFKRDPRAARRKMKEHLVDAKRLLASPSPARTKSSNLVELIRPISRD